MSRNRQNCSLENVKVIIGGATFIVLSTVPELCNKTLKTCFYLSVITPNIAIRIAMAAKIAPLVQKLIAEGKPRFATFMRYAKVELTPPTPGDIPAIRQGIGNLISGAKTGKWKQTTVREAWLNTLVTIEVLCWFYVGECIGKRHIVGYDV